MAFSTRWRESCAPANSSEMTGKDGSAAPDTGEFALIEALFKPLAARTPAALGLTDDAAVFSPTPGRDLVFTKDAMVEGVHFLKTDDPADIAKKLLRVNLSDLAAMGASPVGYLLATFWPETIRRDWIEGFANGLAADQERFGIGLFGGDTVRTPGPLTLSLTAIGEVTRGQALRRNGAKAGDLIAVSGSIGDAALGLQILQHKIKGVAATDAGFLITRYHLPTPRLALAPYLAGVATSCIDISDGLIADIGHIAAQSSLAARIDGRTVPMSPPAREALARDEGLLTVLLSGGDDYELALTFAPGNAAEIDRIAKKADVPLTVIGEMTEGSGVSVIGPKGQQLVYESGGWRHF